jgi:hypothetical protein
VKCDLGGPWQPAWLRVGVGSYSALPCARVPIFTGRQVQLLREVCRVGVVSESQVSAEVSFFTTVLHGCEGPKIRIRFASAV